MGTSLQDDPIPRNRHASATRTPFYISLPLRVVGVRADGGYGSAPHACIVREPGPESSSFLLRVGPGSRIANDSMAVSWERREFLTARHMEEKRVSRGIDMFSFRRGHGYRMVPSSLLPGVVRTAVTKPHQRRERREIRERR